MSRLTSTSTSGRSAKFWLSPVSLARNYGYPDRELNTLHAKIHAKIEECETDFLRNWNEHRVDNVRVTEERLEVLLKDGRQISVPLDWYPRLKTASPENRAIWEPCAAGYGIHWPTIDEDQSVEGLLRGTPADAHDLG